MKPSLSEALRELLSDERHTFAPTAAYLIGQAANALEDVMRLEAARAHLDAASRRTKRSVTMPFPAGGIDEREPLGGLGIRLSTGKVETCGLDDAAKPAGEWDGHTWDAARGAASGPVSATEAALWRVSESELKPGPACPTPPRADADEAMDSARMTFQMRLERDLDTARADATALRAALGLAQRERNEARTALAAMTAERDRKHEEGWSWMQVAGERERERDALKAECERLREQSAGFPKGFRSWKDYGEAMLKARTAPPVMLTDIEKAAHEISAFVLREINRGVVVPDPAKLLSILRSCTRTLDREEIARACGDETSINYRAADAILRLLGQAQTEKAVDRYMRAEAALAKGECPKHGAKCSAPDPDPLAYMDEPIPPPAPVDEAEVERVAKAIFAAWRGPRPADESDSETAARAAIQALGQREQPDRIDSGTATILADLKAENAKLHVALGQREASVDVDGLSEEMHQTSDHMTYREIRALIAKHARPGQRAKAGSADDARHSLWQEIAETLKARGFWTGGAYTDSDRGSNLIAAVGLALDAGQRAKAGGETAVLGDNDSWTGPAAREAEWTEEQLRKGAQAMFEVRAQVTTGEVCAAIAKAAPAFVEPIVLPKHRARGAGFREERFAQGWNDCLGKCAAALTARGLRVEGGAP